MKKDNSQITNTKIETKDVVENGKTKRITTTTTVEEEFINKDILIFFNLDRSGSMWDIRQDTIGAYNQFIADQRKNKIEGSTTYLWLAQFAEPGQTQYLDNRPIDIVEELNELNYQARGSSTALWDAVGSAIEKVDALPDKPGHILIVTLTDGQENSSEKYNATKVRALVADRQKQGWEFIFLGANMDSYEVGGSAGFARGSTRNFVATGQGIRAGMSMTSAATVNYRTASASGVYNVGTFFEPDTTANTTTTTATVEPDTDTTK